MPDIASAIMLAMVCLVFYAVIFKYLSQNSCEREIFFRMHHYPGTCLSLPSFTSIFCRLVTGQCPVTFSINLLYKRSQSIN